jgi:hypothetical protein
MTQIDSEPRCVNVNQLVRDCRSRVLAAHKVHADAGAVAAIACGSILLSAHVLAGNLSADVLDELAEVADNLGLPRRLGQDVVDCAVAAGASFYRDMATACEHGAIEGVAT